MAAVYENGGLDIRSKANMIMAISWHFKFIIIISNNSMEDMPMNKQSDIRFLYDKTSHMELIICNQSTVSYPLHNHVSVFTIGMLFDGSITLNTSKGSKTFVKNGVFAIPPYMPHSIQVQEPYTLLSICINKNIFTYENLDSIKNKIISLLNNALDINTINYQQMMIKLLNSLTYFGDNILESKSSFIDNLRIQLELFPEAKFSVEEMASLAYISKYHFIRSFKQEVGLTPHKFQIQNRIRKAKQLLHEIDTIAEVALTTGFCDQSHFVKQFEKIVGVTPTIYKSSCDIVKPRQE